jgi:hypothetical protein
LEIPGFSLTYVWFKSDFPLPRHSHQMDCAYYIVGGSLQIGGDVLGKGDGFFVPANMPYTYIAGPKGVEVLEFRQHACHDIRLMADNPAFWEKVAASAPVNRALGKRISPLTDAWEGGRLTGRCKSPAFLLSCVMADHIRVEWQVCVQQQIPQSRQAPSPESGAAQEQC